MSLKINNLEIENVKRVKAVRLEPSQNGLTVIGGKNGQGKTSVLDAIAWALGGDKFKPSTPLREGSMAQPNLRVELSNGLVVERTGKNSNLKVIDMYEDAILELEPLDKRVGNWVQEYNTDEEAFLFASSQFSRFQEVEKFLEENFKDPEYLKTRINKK